MEATGWTTEVADIAAEGFDARYTEADYAVLRGTGAVPADVRREQERVERADTVVLIHPVYWWSMPALLKGWIDRVFTFGWAFGTEEATTLTQRDIHLVRLAGNAPDTYTNHGYREAMRTSVEHGIFEFASGPLASTHLLHTAPEGIETRFADSVQAITSEVTSTEAPMVAL